MSTLLNRGGAARILPPVLASRKVLALAKIAVEEGKSLQVWQTSLDMASPRYGILDAGSQDESIRLQNADLS